MRKQTLTIMMVFVIFLCGCSPKKAMKKPIHFYYLRNDSVEQIADYSKVDAAGKTLDEILSQYFQGPKDRAKFQEFPEEVKSCKFYVSGGILYLEFSDSFSRHCGAELIALCACITRTVGQMDGIQQVQFSCPNEKLNDQAYLVMSPSQVVFVDTYSPVETTSPTR